MIDQFKPLKAEIISVGTEILLGAITDTNANYISSQLPNLGIGNYRVTTVGDNISRLTSILKEACDRSDIIILTGGLGPTEDDVTREALAQITGEEPTLDSDLENDLRDFFKQRGIPMPDTNLKQAEIIPSAETIKNNRGTAPGWWVTKNKTVLIAMPGVPREMYEMWEKEVVPKLNEIFKDRKALIQSRTVKTFGMSEAIVDNRLGDLLKGTNPTIGVYAKIDGIHIRITAFGKTADEISSLIKPIEEQIVKLMGLHVWGYDTDSMEGLIKEYFSAKGKTLAAMESCTGGLLTNILTNQPGASQYLIGSFITYSEQLKKDMGVPDQILADHGTISAQCATAMASAAREKANASIGVSITGVAGPDSSEGKSPGIAYIAISDGVQSKVREGIFPNNREDFKLRVTRTAMFEIMRWIQEQD